MKRKAKSKWMLLKDLPNSSAKAGMVFEWDAEEGAYTTKELPWFLTPMIPYSEITKKKWFERREIK